jgi:hypothetical protein
MTTRSTDDGDGDDDDDCSSMEMRWQEETNTAHTRSADVRSKKKPAAATT